MNRVMFAFPLEGGLELIATFLTVVKPSCVSMKVPTFIKWHVKHCFTPVSEWFMCDI